MQYFNFNGKENIFFILAVILGSILGIASPSFGEIIANYIDYAIFLLVFLVFASTTFIFNTDILKHIRFITVSWILNFLLIPLIGFVITSIFFQNHDMLSLGLFIYFFAPCTDWFLGFTKIAGGNVAIGSALIPINMVSQLILYPSYLSLFTKQHINFSFSIIDPIFKWFILPFLFAMLGQIFFKIFFTERRFHQIRMKIDSVVSLVISLVIFFIFGSNIRNIIDYSNFLPIIVFSALLFFGITFFLSQTIAKILKVSRGDRILLTMTTAARNAPLMLSITMIAFPGKPLMYTVIIIGMLIEFLHLSLLTNFFRKNIAMENSS